jgi:hypothetical protein
LVDRDAVDGQRIHTLSESLEGGVHAVDGGTESCHGVGLRLREVGDDWREKQGADKVSAGGSKSVDAELVTRAIREA